jgi:fructuronate reductase
MDKRLTAKTARHLPAAVALPRYDRSKIGAGIVHLGVGAFHRAHQAWYTDEVLNQQGGDWAIVGASLRSAAVSEQLLPQDCLYTLLEKQDGEVSVRLLGAIQALLVAAHDPAALIARLAAVTTRIVSLSITEKAYYQARNFAQQPGLDLQHSDIQHDLQHYQSHPITALGYLVAALEVRMTEGLPGLSLLSCDNLPNNGGVLRTVVTAFAQRVNPALAAWIAEHVSFPATMVDRIVPATTAEDINQVQSYLGVLDKAVVCTEPFSQWVIEDNFSQGRPDWQLAGALFVDDVAPFEAAKLRLLNGSHSLIAYLGCLAGYDYVHQVVADPDFNRLIHLYMGEVAPGLDLPNSFDLAQYRQTLLDRFGNAALNHRTSQIAEDGSQKVVQRWLHTVADKNCQQLTVHALAFAGWLRFIGGVTDAGLNFTIKDPQQAELAQLAATAENTERAAAEDKQIIEKVLALLGQELLLTSNPVFINQVQDCYQRLAKQGVKATIKQAIQKGTT